MNAPIDPLPPLSVGEFAPWFSAAAPGNPNYSFNTSAGRYVLLAFLPPPGAARERAEAAFEAHASFFDDHKLTCFMVLRDTASIAVAKNRAPGLRWFFDQLLDPFLVLREAALVRFELHEDDTIFLELDAVDG